VCVWLITTNLLKLEKTLLAQQTKVLLQAKEKKMLRIFEKLRKKKILAYSNQ